MASYFPAEWANKTDDKAIDVRRPLFLLKSDTQTTLLRVVLRATQQV